MDRRALTIGLPVIAFAALGFTLGDAGGVHAWVVAVLADVVLAVACRHLPWRHVPADTVALVFALGVVALAAGPSLHLDTVLDGAGSLDAVRVFAL